MHKLPFEDSKITFGIHKGKIIKKIPDDYLKFLLSKNILKGKLLFHCQIRFNLPKNKYEIIVTDTANNTDGKYIIEAYNSKNAIYQCKTNYGIQCSQSHHGTEFSLKKL